MSLRWLLAIDHQPSDKLRLAKGSTVVRPLLKLMSCRELQGKFLSLFSRKEVKTPFVLLFQSSRRYCSYYGRGLMAL